MASIRKRTWTTKGTEQMAWVVDYKDQEGKRALKTFAPRKEAEAWSVNALHEVQLGTHTRASASKTVAEAWLLWLEQCEADKLEFGTIRGRRQHLKVHVEIGPPKSKAGKRDIPLAPIVLNTLKQWRIDCPKGELDLVFPNGRGKIERMSNIHELAWYPLQIKCGLTVDTGKIDADGKPILAHRYGFHMLRHAAASLFIA